jgi:hypothetical protein
MTGYERKLPRLRNDAPARVRNEAELTGGGFWQPYRTFEIGPGRDVDHRFADGSKRIGCGRPRIAIAL